MTTAWTPWFLVIAAGLNSCLGNILLKYSRKMAPDPGLFSLLFSPWFMGGMFFYAVNVILFAKALDALPVSSAYPVLAGLGFLFLSIASFCFLEESFTLSKALGMAFVLIGVIFLSR